MTERTDGEKLVDIFVETASATAEMQTVREGATSSPHEAHDHLLGILTDHGLSAADLLDIAHGTDPNMELRQERLAFERRASRPSLLEIAQRAFGVAAQERVSAVINGRPLTVTNFNPTATESALVIPNRNVRPEDVPTEVSGKFVYTTLNASSLVMTADHPVYEPSHAVPPTEDDDLTEHPTPQRLSHTVQVFPVRRVNPYTHQFVPQVDIKIHDQ